MTLELWRRISAIFNPKIRSTLRPGVGALIGKRFVFIVSFAIDEGQYAGQTAFTCNEQEWEEAEAGWVPAEDLDDPEPVAHVWQF